MHRQNFGRAVSSILVMLMIIMAVGSPPSIRSTHAAPLGCAINIGQGSPNPQAFINAYNQGGQAEWNCPIEEAKRSGSGYVQLFRGGAAGNGVLTLADNATQAYWSKSGIGRAWEQWGMGSSPLGYPIGREFVAGQSPFGTQGWGQQYKQGYIHYWTNGRVYYTVNDIMKAYSRCGGSSGWLGFPTSNELVTSLGWQSNFEAGYIQAYRGQAPQVFNQQGHKVTCS